MPIQIHTISTNSNKPAVSLLAEELLQHIKASKKILWLVSGGSCIPVAVEVQKIISKSKRVSNLDVCLIDERFGQVGHPDSNATQLLAAGFQTNGLSFHHVLVGKSPEQTTSEYGRLIEVLMSKTDVSIGLFGMGADGHTAGLLPGNPIMDVDELVGCYQASDYKRISLTPKAVASIDRAILFAAGEVKWPALAQFLESDQKDRLPVEILKNVQNITVFSDY